MCGYKMFSPEICEILELAVIFYFFLPPFFLFTPQIIFFRTSFLPSFQQAPTGLLAIGLIITDYRHRNGDFKIELPPQIALVFRATM